MTEERVPFKYKSKTDAEIEALAQDVVAGRVYTSAQCREQDLQMVFMMLVFLKPEDIEDLQREKITMFYEYMDKAGPRSVNGQPSFLSIQYLDEADFAKFRERVKEIYEFMKGRADAAAAKAGS